MIRTDVLAAIVGALVGVLATAMLGSGITLEYRTRVVEKYFDIPDQIRGDLKVEHKGEQLHNISVVEFAIYNRSWWEDASDVTLYFRVNASKDGQVPSLISKSLSGPTELGRIGIRELVMDERNVLAYKLDTLKRSRNNDYYRASFIFEGGVAPLVSVATNDRNLQIEPYNERYESVLVGAIVVLFYSVLVGVLLYLGERSDKKAREKFCFAFKEQLKISGFTGDVSDSIASIYEEVLEARKTKLAKLIRRVFCRSCAEGKTRRIQVRSDHMGS